jgi:hypothetical protein
MANHRTDVPDVDGLAPAFPQMFELLDSPPA